MIHRTPRRAVEGPTRRAAGLTRTQRVAPSDLPWNPTGARSRNTLSPTAGRRSWSRRPSFGLGGRKLRASYGVRPRQPEYSTWRGGAGVSSGKMNRKYRFTTDCQKWPPSPEPPPNVEKRLRTNLAAPTKSSSRRPSSSITFSRVPPNTASSPRISSGESWPGTKGPRESTATTPVRSSDNRVTCSTSRRRSSVGCRAPPTCARGGTCHWAVSPSL